ncbi:MAG: glycosyltransferase [bacterium]|nr:glycosyltransferase [bacterium]
MKIAICGTRGIPACYGGFETFAEEISHRLANQGHDVIVYGRSHVINYKQNTYRGVRIKLLPAPRHKYLETPVHTFLSFLHILFNPVDVILLCNAANSPFIWVPRLRRIPVAVNVDGIERKRAKWSSLGKLWYRLGELSSVMMANKVISDADVIRDYYKATYRIDSSVIRYGFSERSPKVVEAKAAGKENDELELPEEIFSDLGIKKGSYILYVSRLEPENNAHRVIAAYNSLPSPKIPLVIVGDAPYADSYKQSLHELAGDGVIFAGYRFREDYVNLQLGANFYIQATEVGGTHPALVEAMGFANCIIANGTPENREVVGDAALVYDTNNEKELSALIAKLLSNSETVKEYRRKAFVRARSLFNWDKITNEYSILLSELKKGR